MRIASRFALAFALGVTLVTALALGGAGLLVVRDLEDAKSLLRRDQRLNLMLDQQSRLVDMGYFYGRRLYAPLKRRDVGALNQEIHDLRINSQLLSFEVVGPDHRVVTDGQPGNPRQGEVLEDSRFATFNLQVPHVFSEPDRLGVVFPIQTEGGPVGYGRILFSDEELNALVARSEDLLVTAWGRFRASLVSLFLAAIGLSLLSAGFLAWVVSRYLSRPLLAMSRAAQTFAGGNLDHRLPVSGDDEVGRLAMAMNQMADDLQKSRRLLAKAQEISGIGSWEYNPKTGRFRWSDQCYRIFGLAGSTFAPTRRSVGVYVGEAEWGRILHHFEEELSRPEHCAGGDGFGASPTSHEFSILRADGQQRVLQMLAAPACTTPGQVRIFGTFQDITDRKQSQERLMYLANFDLLTGLPNRALFRDRLAHALTQAERGGERGGHKGALLFIDLDRFKTVNDTLGHGVGDELLQQVAQRLRQSVREGDTVARLGGDEFTVILENLPSTEAVSAVAQKLMESLSRTYPLGSHEIFVTPSIGITVFPDDARDLAKLIKNADTAMYQAKEHGRNTYRFFTEEMNTRISERLDLETRLRGALGRGEFYLEYQPQWDAGRGQLFGFEALLRWRTETGRLVPPVKFIPILEETGMIVTVGEWVLRKACRWVAAFREETGVPVLIAVNLSPRQFQHADLPRVVAAALADSGLPPSALELEITEGALVEAQSSVVTLEALRRLGVHLAVDDFGTGYSSLAYLKRFPVDTLKIDQSFIRDLTVDEDDEVITQAIISLARSLGMRVIAEGVETPAQLSLLTGRGCTLVQGYLIGRPMPPEAVLPWLAQTAGPLPAQGVLPGVAHTRGLSLVAS